MWSRRRYMLLRLSLNRNVSVGSVLVCSTAIMSAYKSTMRTLGYPPAGGGGALFSML